MKSCLLIIICALFLTSSATFAADDKFIVVIDAGHGGKDSGAARGEYKEKEINLGVALALGRLIESNLRNVKIVYTRKSDVFVDLYKRSDIANKAKANLFISIHTNSTAAKTTTANGADTYILGLARSAENLAVAKRENSVILLENDYNTRYEGFDPNSPESNIIFGFMTDQYMSQSLDFASSVQKGFKSIAKRKDNGVRQAGFLVLRQTAMPSVLIELGFINNPQEAKYLSSSTGQRNMASAIYAGVEKYVREFDKKRGGVKPRDYVAVDIPKNNVEPPVVEKPVVKSFERPVEKVAYKPVEEVDSSLIYVAELPDSTDTEKSLVDTIDAIDPNENVPVVTRRERNQQMVTTTTTTKPRGEERKNNTEVKTPVTKGNYASDVIEYRVQFLISPTKLGANSSQLRGLSPVTFYKEGNIFKYTYGSTDDEKQAVQIRNEVRKKFKDAFVVKFKDGVRSK